MDPTGKASLTEQQQKWFASVRANLERETGRSLAQWVEIARTCPETTPRARLRWFKSEHNLLQNRASLVLGEAFPEARHWSDPDAVRGALWSSPEAVQILEAVEIEVGRLGGVLQGQRKSYTAWSRTAQFAALRPLKGGGAMLGLALRPDQDPRLEAPRNESWSERLKGRLRLADPREAASVGGLLRAAWEVS